MARFDPDAAYGFKRGPRGEILFFPRGCWGRGYVVPDEAHAELIAQRQDVLYRWAHFWAMLFMALSPFPGVWRRMLFLCVAMSLTRTVARRRLRLLIMGLPVSEARLHWREILAQAKAELVAEARATSWWIRVALVVVIVALVISLTSR
jgi:hypothetical protein